MPNRSRTSGSFWKDACTTSSDGLRRRMEAASEEMRFEQAAALRDLIATVLEMDEKQKMAAASGDDTDILRLLR